jgi:hypothetical protein
MPSFDLSAWEEVPVAERVPNGPTHRRRASVCVVKSVALSTCVENKVNGPNRTEQRAREVLGLCSDAVFEGRAFDVCDGAHTYTPDWWCEGRRMAVEVKGEHIHSRDSRIMFDAARSQYPGITWVWARLRTKGRKGKRWEIEIFPANA